MRYHMMILAFVLVAGVTLPGCLGANTPVSLPLLDATNDLKPLPATTLTLPTRCNSTAALRIPTAARPSRIPRTTICAPCAWLTCRRTSRRPRPVFMRS